MSEDQEQKRLVMAGDGTPLDVTGDMTDGQAREQYDEIMKLIRDAEEARAK